MIIYDIEILKAIPGRDGRRLAGIEYAGGWDDHENLGIACICAYDYETDRYRTFLADNLDAFRQLVDRTDLVAGFNSVSFDNNVCRAAGIDVCDAKSYDLLVEAWAAAGLGPKFVYPSHVGFSLDALARANGLTGKTGHGAIAPVEWQRGRMGGVIDYCLEDVRLTKELVDRVIRTGRLRDPRNPSNWLQIRRP